MIPKKDRIRGSLIGGAIGDALGYPVEFVRTYENILKKYGQGGITRYDKLHWWREESAQDAKAWISDDTQMTLYTACGLINARENKGLVLPSIKQAYLEWLETQLQDNDSETNECWISYLPDMKQRRAPGETCMSSLIALRSGRHVNNNSKGCGGIMRVAPIGLWGVSGKRFSTIDECCKVAAEVARVTHQHKFGFLPAALMTYLIYKLACDDSPKVSDLYNYIEEAFEVLERIYPEHIMSICDLNDIVSNALDYVTSDLPDHEAIKQIGEGWVAEEALAIALYCAAKHFDNFENAVVAAVNHGGDSDSTGAITGNILGAAIGYEALPEFYKKDLELHDVIIHVADDLYEGKVSKYH